MPQIDEPTPQHYTEKLWPAVWVWIVALGIAAAGIFIVAPISIPAGFVTAVALFLIETVILLISTPRIVVNEDLLTVGRATIERRFIGTVAGYRDEEATAQRGRKLNGLAFLCLRGWINPVVRIEINDQADPTPYWLTSTRRPEQLVAALTTS